MNHAERSVAGFAHDDFAAGRDAAADGAIELQTPLAELHDEVVVDRPGVLQAKDIAISRLRCPREVVVDRLAGDTAKRARYCGRYVDSRYAFAPASSLMVSRRIFLISRSCCVPLLRSTRPFACGVPAAMIAIPSLAHMPPN